MLPLSALMTSCACPAAASSAAISTTTGKVKRGIFIRRSCARQSGPLERVQTSQTWPPDVKIHTALHNLDVLADAHEPCKSADLIGHQHVGGAELIIVVFDKGRPIPRKSPVDAAADNPAEPIVQAPEVKGSNARQCPADLKLVAGERSAASGVKQDIVERVADARGQARQERESE